MADEPVATEIRFFDMQSRIGRCRYLAYVLGLDLLAMVPAAIGVALMGVSAILGGLILAVTYIALIVYAIAFGVRRLHDLDKSGWWILLMIVPLVNLGLAIYMLFFPGTIGENRFGSQPPPNSGWVIVGTVAYIAVIPLGIIAAIAIPSFAGYAMRAQLVEATTLAAGGEAAVAEYAQDKKAWPASLADVYPAAKQHPAGQFVDSLTASVSSDGLSYGIIATMKTQGVNSTIAGTGVEVWSNDGGQTWHCGPASVNPVDASYLSTTCREIGAP